MPAVQPKPYDCVIIGGGLAGLCLSVQLAKAGHSVALIEKNTYPFHKVCGEYISMESWHFLERLGLNLATLNPPVIDTLCVSAHNGYSITSPLALGGFGISRYTLDYELATLAKQNGVVVLENCKATGVTCVNDVYEITTPQLNLFARIVCGSYGKTEPSFINKRAKRPSKNYIAVKYHIKTEFPNNRIELHNFKDGYCGISKINATTCCICYLTTSQNLQSNNNDIKTLEKNVLMQNPHLKHYFTHADFVFEKPLVISQVSFHKKEMYNQNIFLLGDAAGAIAPLCGNGMSMAMRASKLLAEQLDLFLQNKQSKDELIQAYTQAWNSNFSFRIKAGYYLQQLFGKHATTLLSLKLLKRSPKLFQKLISFTHGQPF